MPKYVFEMMYQFEVDTSSVYDLMGKITPPSFDSAQVVSVDKIGSKVTYFMFDDGSKED